MKFTPLFILAPLSLAVGGCRDQPPTIAITSADPEADIKFNLASLGPEEKRIAEQQKYCPIMDNVRLGEIGRPFKITVNGVTAYVCCENCVQEAQDEPEWALSKILQLMQNRAAEVVPRASLESP
jgi:hypothetical protein